MKRALSSPDLFALVRGWQPLVGARLEQLHRPAVQRFHFKFSLPGHGPRRLLVDLDGWAYLAESPPAEQSRGGFVTALRSRLRRMRLDGVAQFSGDRILLFDFVRAETRYRLVLELFHRGNALLLQDGVIVLALRRRIFRHRTLAPGVAYQPPPAPFNPFAASPEEFTAALANSERPLVSALAVDWNLGGDLAESLATDHNPAQRAAELPVAEAGTLAAQARALLADEPAPALYHRDGALHTVSAYPLMGIERDASYDSCDEAVAAFLAARPVSEPVTAESSVRAQQVHVAAEHEEHARALRRRGELLFAHLGEMRELLELHRGGGELPAAVTYDPHARELHFTIDDETLALGVEQPPEASASAYFDAAKRFEAKARRAHEVMATQARARPPPRSGVAIEEPKAKPEWFERYRWFIASTGEIVVAGRDAMSNDRVVKRYLKECDRYAHADIHGAPSVVVKHCTDPPRTDEPPSAAAMEEACRFGLAFSRAWPVGVASGHAFWVEADAVSKTPNPGEFVPKGAFIIRGQRHWHRNLPVELAVGVIEHRGHRKVMSGPMAAVTAHTGAWALFKPGFTPRERALKALAGALAVPRDALEGKLPPGDIELVQTKGLALEFEAPE